MRTVTSWQRAQWAVLAFMAAVLLAACSGDSDDSEPSRDAEANIVQPGAPGEPSRSLSEEEAARIESPSHTQADVDFMQGMIHHHAQALVMTSMVRDRTASRDVPLLARRLELSGE